MSTTRDRNWKSESQKAIDDVDQLMRRFESEPDEPTARPCRGSCSCGAPRSGDQVGPDFFKKMFLFMMSELA